MPVTHEIAGSSPVASATDLNTTAKPWFFASKELLQVSYRLSGKKGRENQHMPKMRFHLSLMILACLFVLLAWNASRSHSAQAQTFPEVIDVNLEDISKVLIREGSTGNEVLIDEKETIATLLDVLSTLEVEKLASGNTLGWSYYIDLYPDAESYWRLTLAGEKLTLTHTTVDPYQEHTRQHYAVAADFFSVIGNIYASQQ